LLGSAVNVASGKVTKPPLPNWPLEIGSLQERVLASGTGLPLGLESGTADDSGVGVVGRFAAELMARPNPIRGATAPPAPPRPTRTATTTATTLVQVGQLLT